MSNQNSSDKYSKEGRRNDANKSIKYKGYNVEMQRVESVILLHPKIFFDDELHDRVSQIIRNDIIWKEESVINTLDIYNRYLEHFNDNRYHKRDICRYINYLMSAYDNIYIFEFKVKIKDPYRKIDRNIKIKHYYNVGLNKK